MLKTTWKYREMHVENRKTACLSYKGWSECCSNVILLKVIACYSIHWKGKDRKGYFSSCHSLWKLSRSSYCFYCDNLPHIECVIALRDYGTSYTGYTYRFIFFLIGLNSCKNILNSKTSLSSFKIIFTRTCCYSIRYSRYKCMKT